MKNTLFDPEALVLPDAIKRLKLRIFLRERERLHRKRWRRYEARVEEVTQELSEDFEAVEIRNAAKSLLGGSMALTRHLNDREQKRRLHRVAGEPPIRTPWLPERELLQLVDEALQSHYFSKFNEKQRQELAKRRASTVAQDRRGSVVSQDRRGSVAGQERTGLSDRRSSTVGQDRRMSQVRNSISPPAIPGARRTSLNTIETVPSELAANSAASPDRPPSRSL